MAIQAGPLKLTGSLGDLSFYFNKQHGYLVRSKGGGKGAKLSPRTKENSTEFGEASRVSKLIRRALKFSFRTSGDAKVQQRLNSCLSSVLSYDRTSARGQRTAAKALTDPDAVQALAAFAFFSDFPLSAVLSKVPDYDAAGDTLTFENFDAAHDLSWPTGATHVQLQAASLVFDSPGDKHSERVTEPVVFSRCAQMRTLELKHDKHKRSGESGLMAISIIFLQEVNGELVRLTHGMSLGIVNGSFSGDKV